MRVKATLMWCGARSLLATPAPQVECRRAPTLTSTSATAQVAQRLADKATSCKAAERRRQRPRPRQVLHPRLLVVRHLPRQPRLRLHPQRQLRLHLQRHLPGCSTYTTDHIGTGTITPGTTDTGTIAMIAQRPFRFHSRLAFTGRPLTSANVASNGSLRPYRHQSAPSPHGCQVLPNTLLRPWPFCLSGRPAHGCQYRMPVALVERVASSPQRRAPRLTGILTLSGARCYFADTTAQPTSIMK